MADEATVRSLLQIKKNNLEYVSRSGVFSVTIEGVPKGPTPGALTIPVGGKIVLFSELTTPGLCLLTNQDDTNYVEYGMYDPDVPKFYPLGEMGPGETYVIKLSRNLREEYTGTGTGTTAPSSYFFMKADTADVNVSIEAFEK